MDAEKPKTARIETIVEKRQPSASYLLQRAVEDAYYLHSYSITTGKKIPDEVSKTIITFKQQYDAGADSAIDPNLEAEFSRAYRELAAQMAPVTVESLRDTEEVHFDAKLSFVKQLVFSRSRQVAFLLPLVAIVLILLILSCEIIQAIFIPGLQKIAANDQKINELRTGATDMKVVLDQTDRLNKDTVDILTNLNATWKSLPLLPRIAKPVDLDEPQKDETESEKADRDGRKLVPMRPKFAILIEVLNRLLPILYGALGATAYLLRKLIPYINDRTFNKKQAESSSVRICLGMLSGIAIQWFFTGGQQTQLFERSLSTSAMAFLAGYSVELLFNMMDRFTQSFKPLKEAPRSEPETR